MVRDETGNVVWTEYDEHAERPMPTRQPISHSRVEDGVAPVLTVTGSRYRFSAALEPTSEHPNKE